MAADTLDPGPRTRNLSPWFAWVTKLMATEPPGPPPAGSVEELTAWREETAGRLTRLLGPTPDPVPLDLEVTESVDCGRYRRDRIVFDVEDTMSVPAYLLVPNERTEPGAAVLAIHGHGPGKAQVCGLESTEMPNADYGHQLACRGHVVLAPDLRCFGERADWNPPDHYGCDTNLVHTVMAGVSPLTQNLWDLARCLDVLEQHPLVDPERIGAVGISYGGTMSLFLAATDARVRAAVVSGYLSSWAESHKVPWNMCGSQVLPGMLGQMEHVDLGALVAPRALLVETGSDDILFPEAAARATVAQLGDVYALLGAPERLAHDVFPGGHEFHGVEALPFLDAWLEHEPTS